MVDNVYSFEQRIGATRDEWELFADKELGLGLQADLLPIVSNTNATISPNSSLKKLGKTPSYYNAQRHAVGFADWPKHVSTPQDIRRWMREPDYGIGINCRLVRALDVDITDAYLATSVEHEILEFLGFPLPKRFRANSAKFLFAFKMPGEFAKVKLTLRPDAIIEILLTGQQFAAAGTHDSGVRYEWIGLTDIPTISNETLEALIGHLIKTFNAERGGDRSSTSQSESIKRAFENDPVASYLYSKGFVYREDDAGKLIIQCPFADEHSGGSDEAAYFVEHTNGFAKGHFRCLHAHCENRTDNEFLIEIGFNTEAEVDVEDIENRHVANEMRLAAENIFFLPNDHLMPPSAARRIYKILAARRALFLRAGSVCELSNDGQIDIIRPEALQSRLNQDAQRTRSFNRVTKDGRTKYFSEPKVCSKGTASLLLSCKEINLLPPIAAVSRSPVLAASGGELKLAEHGYNEMAGGIVVTNKIVVETVALDDAKRALRGLLYDFKFASSADEGRALVSLISPALRLGRLVNGHALALAVEADSSQTGKGFFLRVIRAIYDEKAYTITLKSGGVGGFDESLNQALLSGRPFIAVDNIRGRLDSQLFESVLTAGNDPISVRVPHQAEVTVDAQSTSFQLTSNGIEATEDFANRIWLVRLRKQPRGYKWRSYTQGNVLEHIAGRRGYYLGCVHAIIREWYRQDCPRLSTTHTFHEWVGTLEWIGQKLLDTGSLLDGHEEATKRVSRPELTWIRNLAMALVRAGKHGTPLTASDLYELCQDLDVPVPGLRSEEVASGAKKIGSHMRKLYNSDDDTELEVEGILVTRTVEIRFTERKQQVEVKWYTFSDRDGL